MSTIALGMALLMMLKGLSDGTLQQMIDSSVRLGSGHVVLQQDGYLELGGVERHLSREQLERAEQWLASQADNMRVEHVVRRAFASGLASSADGSVGVQIIGTEPQRERHASRFQDALIAGSFLEGEGAGEALLGSGVAERLEAWPGTRVVLMAQGAGGEIESVMVRVSGVIRTGLEELDDALVIMPLAAAQEFLSLGGGVHQVALLLSEERNTVRTAAAGAAALEGIEVLSWQDAHPELVGIIQLVGARDALLYAMILALVAFMVLNTMMMAVLERGREFTLLDALGFTPSKRFSMILAEAFTIAALAAVVGLALGYGAHLYFAHAGIPLEVFFDGDVALAGTTLDPVLYSQLSGARI
ncbi:MAG: ABC transporter permease, partial [Gammaproteobacteria bacterium]|nr:ABC transporter permease [Gammaproteobacteria bacterium]